MKRLSMTGILVGGLIQSALGTVAGLGLIPLLDYILHKWCMAGDPEFADIRCSDSAASFGFITYIFLSIFNFMMYILGGFISSLIAKQNEILNSVLTIWPLVLYNVMIIFFKILSQSHIQAVNFGSGLLIGLCIGLVGCACGGFIGQRKNSRTRGRAAT